MTTRVKITCLRPDLYRSHDVDGDEDCVSVSTGFSEDPQVRKLTLEQVGLMSTIWMLAGGDNHGTIRFDELPEKWRSEAGFEEKLEALVKLGFIIVSIEK